MPAAERDRILDAAAARFFSHGFSRVTMDDLARDLAMSKKTLYRHFNSKDALLEAVMDRFTAELGDEMDRIITDLGVDFPDKLAGVLDAVGRRVARLDRFIADDITRHAPAVWKRIETFRRERIFTNFSALFREGVERGHLRSDLDPGLILQIYFHAVQNIINPRTLATLPYSAAQVFDTLLSVLFEGMLTERGRRKQRPAPRRKEN